jgi:hypothetical protein
VGGRTYEVPSSWMVGVGNGILRGEDDEDFGCHIDCLLTFEYFM